MAKTLLVGPGGAGKTEALWQRYRTFTQKNRTDGILVLLCNARDVKEWRERVDFPRAGPLHVYTYFGWLQREIRRCWQRLSPWGEHWLEPEFLTVETSQFAMLERLQALGKDFADLVTSPERLAIQLGSAIVLASLNGIPFTEIGPRLRAALPAQEPRLFTAAQDVIDSYIAAAESAGILDYGLGAALYSRLLAEPWYRKDLKQFSILLADDLDEQPPAAHDLVEALLTSVKTAVLTMSTDGGHAGFFGADRQGAWRRFGAVGKIDLVRNPAQALGGGRALYNCLVRSATPVLPKRLPQIEYLHEDLRSELLETVTKGVLHLLNQGIAAGDIAVIAPLVDSVLEYTLALGLDRAGTALNILTKNRRLIDAPYVRALMTITLLAHPGWQLDWGLPDLAQSFQLLFKIDPVRAWFLSRQVHGSSLGSLELWQRERVGFRTAQGYDLLRQWLEDYRQGPEQPVDLFLQRVFGELLSRLPPARDDLVVCRQLLVSARKFLANAQRLNLGDSPNVAFIRMLSSGAVAAESLLTPAAQEGAVILTTPYAYISGHYHSDIQFWLDCTSRRWFQQDAKELVNPHVLSRRWPEHQVWTDEHNLSFSRDNCGRTVRALLRRCNKRLFVTAASVDSQGYEQDGGLLAAVQDAFGRGGEASAFPTGSD